MKYPIHIDFILDSKNSFDEKLSEKLKFSLNNVLKELKEDKEFDIVLNIDHSQTSLPLDLNAHVTFFEISERDPIIMYKAGYHKAKNASSSFIQINDNRERLHSSINDIVLFSDLENLISKKSINQTLKNVLKKEIETYFFPNNHFSKFWFNKNESEEKIFIVGGPDDDKSSEILNQNIYDYGDKDTFIETCIFLSKNYPDYDIRTKTSNAVGLDWKNNHLVVIGGPGVEDDAGNTVCLELMNAIGSKIKYGVKGKGENTPQDTYYLSCENKEYFSVLEKYRNSEKVTKDYGYFASFMNPFNSDKRVILINGIHTLGVLGAFRTFSDTKVGSQSKANCKNVIGKFLDFFSQDAFKSESLIGFECFFEVLSGDELRPPVPIIKPENIYFFKKNENENSEVFLSHSSKDRNQTLRIKNTLEEKGISVFMAPWDMEVGDWKPQIKTKIKNEDLKILVLVLTENSQESEVVKFEIETAIDEGKEMIAFQSEEFKIKPSFGLLINGKHNILAYDDTYEKPTDILIEKIANHLKKK